MRHPCLFRVVIAFLLFAYANSSADNGYAVVTKDIAKVLLMPYGDSKALGMARKGDRCKIISKSGDWFNIEFKGSVGWIFKANIEITEAPPAPVAPAPVQAQRPAAPSPPPPPAEKPAQAVVPPRQAVPPQNEGSDVPRQMPPVENTALHPEEKPEPSSEQAQKKNGHKQKRVQNALIDLPPAQVMPASGTPENIAPAARGTHTGNEPGKPQDALGGRGQQQQAVQKYFEITESSARILATVSPDSPILGIARNSECYPLLYAGAAWCKIQYGGNIGWVDRRYGRIVDAPTAATKVPQIVLFVLLGGVALVLVVLAIILVVISLRTGSTRKVVVKKDLLLIAKSEKHIQYSLTDTTTTMSKCFSEIGFQIETASTFERAASLLAHYVPDVIVVDWQVHDAPLSLLNSGFSGTRFAADGLVIFYNVPDAEAASNRETTSNVHFLGLAFSDRDIFRLVTPLIMSKSGTKSIRKSVETSALGGEIGQGSLIEVMQFIEIGRKTGCLYVVIDKPFGLIYFEQGRIHYAATQTRQSRDAVFELLNLKKGHFHFVLDKKSQTQNIDLSTLEILMEWTKTVDEAHRR